MKLNKAGPQSSQDCGSVFFVPWAAGTGSPAGSPYTVGVKEPTENQRNGIVEIFVFKTVGLNVRLQRSRGEPQARHPAWSALISEIDGVGAAPGLRSNPVRSARSGNIPFATDKMPPEPPVPPGPRPSGSLYSMGISCRFLLHNMNSRPLLQTHRRLRF